MPHQLLLFDGKIAIDGQSPKDFAEKGIVRVY
jgi:hypothetical protein